MPFPTLGNLTDPGIEPRSLASPTLAVGLFITRAKFGEGNGTPLQYSCLENPMDGGAWEAAVHGVARVRHDWATSLSLFTFIHWRRKWQPTPVFLPGESGMAEPGGLPSMGSHRVRHDWSDLAAAAVEPNYSFWLYRVLPNRSSGEYDFHFPMWLKNFTLNQLWKPQNKYI